MRAPVLHSARLTLRILATTAFTLGPTVFAESFSSAALVTPRPKPNDPYRYFGGRTVTVPLLIHAPETEELSIRAELWQLATNLLAPVGGELEVPLSAAAGAGPASELDFSVALPAVKRETDFELRFRSCRQGTQVWQAAGRIPLRVYPADLLGSVRAWAESHPVQVEDDHGSVIELLRLHGIPIATQPGARGVTLYAGPRALEKQARLPFRHDEMAIVIFAESQTEIPRLFIDRTGRQTTVRVEMRVLDRLAADPLAQKVILEVFKLLQEQAPLNTGVIP